MSLTIRSLWGAVFCFMLAACGDAEGGRDGASQKSDQLGAASRNSWTAIGAVAPVSSVAGATLATVRVALTDSTNAVVPSSTLPVTVSISGNTAVLGGTTTVNAVNGIATFTDLVITRVGSYRLIASAPGMLSGTSVVFTVTAAPADHLDFTMQPTPVSAGALFSPVVQVSVLDAWGNPSLAPASITVALGDNPGSSTLTGTTTLNTTTGRATFSTLKLNRPGNGYSLTATSAGLPTILSGAFDVLLGPASRFVVISGSGQAANVGQPVTFPLIIESQDAVGNKVPGASVDWVVAIGNGTVTAGSTMTDATTARAQATMVLGTTSGSQRVEARAPGVTSAAFTFTGRALAATQLALVSGDGQTGTAGAALTAPLVVAVTDMYGNPVASQAVTFSVGSGAGGVVAAAPRTDSAGRISATATLGALAGLNEFRATKAGLTGSPVTFSATGVAGAPALVVFGPGPTATIVGEVMAPVTVTVSDAQGNAIDGASVVLSLGGGAAGAVLSGTTTTSTVGGSAAFTDLAIDRIGAAFTLIATVDAVTQTSTTFDITCTAGLTACAGQCVDATTDLNNCGACGTVCSGNHANAMSCTAGQCGIAACQPSFGNCDGATPNGCETSLVSNAAHCGACGRACPAGVACQQGMCGGADDAVTGFSTTSNPTATWQYGKKTAGTFALFTAASTDSAGNEQWSDGASAEPAVLFNRTGAATSVGGGTLAAGALAMMPGASEPAVLRYTAPAAGTYRLYVDFEGLVHTSQTLTFSETRSRYTRYCRYQFIFCGDYDPTPHPVGYSPCCAPNDVWEAHTQSRSVTIPLHSTPAFGVQVNGVNAWGPGAFDATLRGDSVSFGWSGAYQWSPAARFQFYYWAEPTETAHHGATTLTLRAGDVVDVEVGAGWNGNAGDLTRVQARVELACPVGFRDCDGDAANGCEIDTALSGGACESELASKSTEGLESTGHAAAVSDDGRFVVFAGEVPSATANATFTGIYLRDRISRTTTLLSRGPTGELPNGTSDTPRLTPDARYIAFRSWANNLVTNDSNGVGDVFVVERATGVVERISTGNGFASDPSISEDGRWVAFTSTATDLVTGDTNSFYDLFVKDRATGDVTRVLAAGGAEPNAGLFQPRLAADGQTVAFHSDASNLVTSDGNGASDVFVADLVTHGVIRVSESATGTDADSTSYLVDLSKDHVAFRSAATNLGCGSPPSGAYQGHVRNLRTGEVTCLPSTQIPLSLSRNGRWLAFYTQDALVGSDTDSAFDVYALDRLTGGVDLLSPDTNGASQRTSAASAALSRDGRFVAFAGAGHSLSAEAGSAGSHVYVGPVSRPSEVWATRFPSTATAGAGISFTGTLFDERGNVAQVSGLPITLELAQGPAGATFTAMNVNTTRGASLFSLSLQAAGTYSFTLSAPGYASRGFGPITVSAGAPAAITIVSGDAQTATVASVASPFIVRVVDAFGNPLAGQQVDWSVVQGAGTLTPASSTTDSTGETAATATLSTVSGANSFLATSGALAAAFSALGIAGEPASVSWSVQPTTTTAGVVMAPAPTLALVDGYGNPVDTLSASATVGWRHGGIVPGGQSLQGTTTVALSGGFAVFPGLYAHEAGTDFFSGAVSGLEALSDAVTILPGPVNATLSSISALSPTAEADGVATINILVHAADQFGNAITGALPDVVVSGNGNLLTQPGPTLAGGATAALASTRAETKTISATINGVALAMTTQVTFTPLSTCAVATSDCNGDSTDGCETDLTSVATCGACGVACGGGMACTGGTCACPSETPTACGTGPTGYCTDLTTDTANCGGCGAACAAGQACTAQGCTDTCTETQPPDEVVAVELEPTGGNLVPGVVDSATFRVFGRMRRTPWQRVDVTAQATFSSSNASTVDVSATGVAQSPGGAPGTETLSATVNGHTATARVRVWDPARYAQLSALALSAPGHHMHVPIGTCFPVQCIATFSDTSTEDVSETTDFAVVGLNAPANSSRQPEMRVMDQNLLTINGGPFQNPDIGRYVDLLGQLVPGGLTSPRITGYVGGKGGTCADARSPGAISAVATNPNAPALYTDQTMELPSAALYADFSVRDVSSQAQLRTCAPTALHVARDGWITGLSAGPALVTTTVGSQVGHTAVTVYGPHPSLGTLTGFRLRPSAANVEPGQTFDLRGVATWSGTGTALFNVTSQTTWTSSNTDISPVPVLGHGVAGATIGTSDISATFDGVTTAGAVRTWPPGRLASITSFAVIRPDLYQAQGTCAQLVLRVTFDNTPTDFEDLTRNANWWQGWKCFGDLSPTGLFWTRGPFCSSGVYLDLYGSMGFGLPSGQTVINSSPIPGMADDYRDPVSCP